MRYCTDARVFVEQLQSISPVRYAGYIGPASRTNPYGGLIFYSILVVEIMLQHHGIDVISVNVTGHPSGVGRSNITVTCSFGDETLVYLGVIGDGTYHFHLLAVGREGVANIPIQLKENYFVAAIHELLAVLRSEKESAIAHNEMLRAVQVCAAIEESLQQRTPVDPRSLL